MANSNPIPYSKHNLDSPASYNGGTFQSANAAVAGCSGQSCNSLAAKSVFAEPVNNCALSNSKGLPALASNAGGALTSSLSKLAGGLSKMIGGRKTRKRKGKKSKGKKSKGKKSKHIKSKSSKRSKVHRKQTKHRHHNSKKRRRYHRTKKVMHGGKQMMSNICHSAGHSIGPVTTSLKPNEVGLAAGHFTPYTKTQNN